MVMLSMAVCCLMIASFVVIITTHTVDCFWLAHVHDMLVDGPLQTLLRLLSYQVLRSHPYGQLRWRRLCQAASRMYSMTL